MKLLQRTRNPVDNLSRKPDIQLTKRRSTSSPTVVFRLPPAPSSLLPRRWRSPPPPENPSDFSRLTAVPRHWRGTDCHRSVIELSQIARRARKPSAAKGLRPIPRRARSAARQQTPPLSRNCHGTVTNPRAGRTDGARKKVIPAFGRDLSPGADAGAGSAKKDIPGFDDHAASTAATAMRAGGEKTYPRGSGQPLFFARGDAEARRRERLCTRRREAAKTRRKKKGLTQRRRDAEVPNMWARHCVAPTRFVIPAYAEPMDEPAATKEKI